MATALTNSQRRTYKATYAPTQIDPKNQQDVEASTRITRALEKVGFVRSLELYEAELPVLRERIQQSQTSPDVQQQLLKALDLIEPLARDPSPLATLRHAPSFAALSIDTLVTLGHLLANARQKLADEILASLQQISLQHMAALQQANHTPSAVASNESLGQMSPESSHIVAAGNTQSKMVALTPYQSQNSSPIPPLLETIQWGLAQGLPQIEELYTHARALTPAASSLSALGTQAVLLDFLSRVQIWGAATESAASGFQEHRDIQPIGRLHLERLDMTPVGLERGELVHSVPLTPKETVNISHKEWATTTQEFESIVQDFFEGYSEQGVAEKNDLSQSTDSQSKHSTALNVGASLSASYSSVTLSSSFGYNATSDDSQALKDSRNHSVSVTRQSSARTRKDHKITFKVTSVAGSEDQSVRVITNPSDTNAMRVDYYQLMRKWRVDLYRYGLRLTYDIAIPNPGVDLIHQLQDLSNLDALINAPPNFPVAVAQVTPDTWITLAAQYNASVDPPPELTRTIASHKEIDKSEQDAANYNYDFIDFEVDENYYVDQATLTMDANLWTHDAHNFVILGLGRDTLGQSPVDLPFLQGLSGTFSVIYRYQGINRASISVNLSLKVKDTVLQAWQFKAWEAMSQAYLEAYERDRQILKERRDALAAEIGQWDALTLRQMEQEAMMKGVMRWLFGPAFEFVPADVETILKKPPDTLSFEEWERVIGFGEFVKYIHQAIEWENILYFTYPYFWDLPENWDFKLFLNHPDALHRIFLRAGSARVVLTIRPGFEESFTQLLETGAFGELPGNHPYLTIAQEIENYAKTNYPGIPPANPDGSVDDGAVEKGELGILAARWYEYTPTSAMDISINTKLGELA